jgi:Rrf2 family iron-sulfur cluster assembly transcriptional regulator
MRLTTRSRYGTRILLDIALYQDKGWVSTSDIAARQKISQKYLEKLVTGLRQNGLIQSKRGPFGGHKLAKPADAITVGDVVRALEEQLLISSCSDGERLCGKCTLAGECVTQFVWIEASNVLLQTLDSYRLSDLLRRRG